KLQAEKLLQDSGLKYSIFRPSVIFGDSNGSQEFSLQLYEDIVKPPLPAPEFLARWLPPQKAVIMSPVAIGDVVDAIIRQIEDPVGGKQIFELGGAEQLTWRQMLERIAAATGRKKLFVPVPISLMKIPAALFGRFRFFPVSLDQLRMLAEGNVVDVITLKSLINREPLRFEPENLSYLNKETV
ncbi:MAG: complex I NDUFA9 subunit family protein, partial [Pseudomonadota bacterium]